jgi:hypothetical protein
VENDAGNFWDYLGMKVDLKKEPDLTILPPNGDLESQKLFLNKNASILVEVWDEWKSGLGGEDLKNFLECLEGSDKFNLKIFAGYKDLDDKRSSSGVYVSTDFPDVEIRLHVSEINGKLAKAALAKTLMHELVHHVEKIYDEQEKGRCICLDQKIAKEFLRHLEYLYKNSKAVKPGDPLQGFSDRVTYKKPLLDDRLRPNKESGVTIQMNVATFLAYEALDEYFKNLRTRGEL